VFQHKAARPAHSVTTSLPRPRASSAYPTALRAAIMRLREIGGINLSIHPTVEAMILFASFAEKRLRLSRIVDLRAEHINKFLQSPVLRKPGCHRSIEEVRRIRKDGALLFLSLIADGKIDSRKKTR
jgi:hypothetical protein